jgi:hypothetical protein
MRPRHADETPSFDEGDTLTYIPTDCCDLSTNEFLSSGYLQAV